MSTGASPQPAISLRKRKDGLSEKLAPFLSSRAVAADRELMIMTPDPARFAYVRSPSHSDSEIIEERLSANIP
jgi:hypothetical protein